MPTTTATISLTNDIASVPTSVTASFDLLKAGSTEGMDEMTSKRKVFKSTDQVDLITALEAPGVADTAADASADSHNYVYIFNASTVSTDYITVTQGNAAGSSTEVIVEQIGRLYAGDWMFIPWSSQVTASGDDVGDICVKPSTANEMPIEYMLFS